MMMSNLTLHVCAKRESDIRRVKALLQMQLRYLNLGPKFWIMLMGRHFYVYLFLRLFSPVLWSMDHARLAR